MYLVKYQLFSHFRSNCINLPKCIKSVPDGIDAFIEVRLYDEGTHPRVAIRLDCPTSGPYQPLPGVAMLGWFIKCPEIAVHLAR